jgi:acid phosphatase
MILSVNASASLAAQQLDVESDRRYDALTWVQNSAEYKQLTRQIYRMALSQLSVGMQDSKWSADEVQIADGGYEEKPPAIILDCDETVLDNSAYNARNVVLGKKYETAIWNAWCQEAQADAIPGALEFVKAAEGMGVKVFYITNRRDVVKEATIKNLLALGFPADEASVMTKNEDENRDGTKVTRRAAVAKDYRIVLLIGDNMSDLCTGMDVPNTKRRNEIALEKMEMLGSRWVMMPNPVYGSWQSALPDAEKALHVKAADVQPSVDKEMKPDSTTKNQED